MNQKIRNLVVALLIGIALLLGTHLLATPKSIKIEFPIDSEEEAIAYAKTDSDVNGFIERCIDSGYEVTIHAHFNKNESLWEVVIAAQSVKDLFFVVIFKPDGTVISKNYGKI